MEETIRTLVAIALGLLLVLHRVEAEKFGAAEYDEPARDGRRTSFLPRLTWYAIGVGLALGIIIVRPALVEELGLALGDRTQALLYGFGFGALGTAQAIAVALFRYGRLRFPPAWAYPGAILNGLGTALVDEVAFRGVILGLLLLLGVNPALVIITQALIYALATRLGAPGRDRYWLVLALVMGLCLGWLTVETGSIGAAFLAHAITRIAMFVCTGHAGQLAPRGREVEDTWEFHRPPPGWHPVGGSGEDPPAPGR
jgi:membrane protease YdiL (CAAX protease family)